MLNEEFWEQHPDIYRYIEKNYTAAKDSKLSRETERGFGILIESEKIRQLRRDKGWKKRKIVEHEEFEKAAFITCPHIPFHDEKLFALLLVFLKYFKPDKLWILGDFIDWYQISDFDKDPRRLLKFQEDLNLGKKLLDALCAMVPKIEFLAGNHENRMIRYLRKHPELYSLDALRVSSLLGLNERDIRYHDYLSPPVKYHGLQIHHGSLVRKYSGWTAKGHYEKYGGCGIIGHSHRGGNFLKRTVAEVCGWYENMCMCNLKPEYLDFADWIQGWSIAYFTKKDLFHLEQIPVIKHKFLFQGKLFSA